MTENKRFQLIYNEYETSNGEIIKAEPYFIDRNEEYIDEVYFTIDGYPTMSDEQVVKLLNEQDAEIEQLKEFKNKVFKEINTELSYLTEKAMDNPVNYGRIKALQGLKRCVE